MYFSLSVTPYYNMVFLIVKMGGDDVSIINGSQGSQHSLTLYESKPFSLLLLLFMIFYIPKQLLKYFFLTGEVLRIQVDKITYDL